MVTVRRQRAGRSLPPSGSRVTAWLAGGVTVVAGALVWAVLAMPSSLAGHGITRFVHLPVEVLVITLIAVLLGRRPLRWVAVVIGVLLALLMVLKVLDLGFNAALDRPFDPVNDWYYLGPAVGVLADEVGRTGAVIAVIVAILVAAAILCLLPLATVRVTAAVARHRRRAVPALAGLTAIWVGCTVAGIGWTPSNPVATSSSSQLAWSTGSRLHHDIIDRGVFARQIASDRYAHTPPGALLTRLRGKDVLLVFVESYGRVALDDPQLAPIVRAGLRTADATLRKAGFSARSAYLTSPTFGGASWLAHSTIESGLWVNSQQRYDQLMPTHRLTLLRAFGQAGWHTVYDMPELNRAWREGKPFYGFDTLYTAQNTGYHGPRFGYAAMPDQYTLRAFWQRALAPRHRAPVMAEIDLLSSHYPWTPPPRLLPWGDVGDGSVYRTAVGRAPLAAADATASPRLIYAQTISYTMRTLASFAATSGDPNLVIIAMGDHQPNHTVTGPGASHQAPAMVIAHDPAVLRAVAGWGWTSGLQPAANAPVRPMSSLRNRILSTFGPAGP